jgi:hypothetical protein
MIRKVERFFIKIFVLSIDSSSSETTTQCLFGDRTHHSKPSEPPLDLGREMILENFEGLMVLRYAGLGVWHSSPMQQDWTQRGSSSEEDLQDMKSLEFNQASGYINLKRCFLCKSFHFFVYFSYCVQSLRSVSHCTQSLHSVIMHSVIALSHYALSHRTQLLHSALTPSRCVES